MWYCSRGLQEPLRGEAGAAKCQIQLAPKALPQAQWSSTAVRGVRNGKTLPGSKEKSVRESPVSSKVRRGGGGEREEGGGAAGTPLDSPAGTGEEHREADHPPAACGRAWEQEAGAEFLAVTAQGLRGTHTRAARSSRTAPPAEDPHWSSSWIPTAHRNAPGWSRRTAWGAEAAERGCIGLSTASTPHPSAPLRGRRWRSPG